MTYHEIKEKKLDGEGRKEKWAPYLNRIQKSPVAKHCHHCTPNRNVKISMVKLTEALGKAELCYSLLN